VTALAPNEATNSECEETQKSSRADEAKDESSNEAHVNSHRPAERE
jgi:hypothetical protein